MQNTHGIIAQDWQITAAKEKRLSAIVLPLVPQGPQTKQIIKLEFLDVIVSDLEEKIISDRLIEKSPYQVGDRIFLKQRYVTIHDFDNGEIDFHKAEEMPQEKALYSYQITSTIAKKIYQVPLHIFLDSGLYNMSEDESEYGAKAIARWNTAHPDYPYSTNLWLLILTVQPIAKP